MAISEREEFKLRALEMTIEAAWVKRASSVAGLDPNSQRGSPRGRRKIGPEAASQNSSSRVAFPSPFLHRPIITCKTVSGVNQGDVTEGLRKIPHLAPIPRIVFLGEEADVVPKGQ